MNKFLEKMNKLLYESNKDKIITLISQQDILSKMTFSVLIALLLSFIPVICNISIIVILIKMFHNSKQIIVTLIFIIPIFILILQTIPIALKNAKNTQYLDKDEYPDLYNSITNLCKKMGSPLINKVYLSTEYNASFQYIGLVPKRVITIGVPLLECLNEEEIKAVLAHEIGHCRQKNHKVWSAINIGLNTIVTWISVLNSISYQRNIPFISLLAPSIWLLKWIFKKYLYVIMSLSWLFSQRMEFDADHKALMVSNKDAIIGLMCKIQFSNIVENCIIESDNFRKDFKEYFRTIGCSRIKDINEIFLNEDDAFVTTHPLLMHRIEAINKAPQGNLLDNNIGFEFKRISSIHYSKFMDMAKKEYFDRVVAYS